MLSPVSHKTFSEVKSRCLRCQRWQRISQLACGSATSTSTLLTMQHCLQLATITALSRSILPPAFPITLERNACLFRYWANVTSFFGQDAQFAFHIFERSSWRGHLGIGVVVSKMLDLFRIDRSSTGCSIFIGQTIVRS